MKNKEITILALFLLLAIPLTQAAFTPSTPSPTTGTRPTTTINTNTLTRGQNNTINVTVTDPDGDALKDYIYICIKSPSNNPTWNKATCNTNTYQKMNCTGNGYKLNCTYNTTVDNTWNNNAKINAIGADNIDWATKWTQKIVTITNPTTTPSPTSTPTLTPTPNPTPTTTPTQTPTPEETFTLNLSSGWNYFSIPLENANPTLQQLHNKCGITRIFYYDSSQQQYLNIQYKNNPNYQLKAGIGYTAYSIGECSIQMSGTPWQFQPIKLKAGQWNLIGTPLKTTIDQIKGNCNIQNLDIIYMDLSSGQLQKIQTTTLQPGKSYWFKTTTTCTLQTTNPTPSPTVTPTPTICNETDNGNKPETPATITLGKQTQKDQCLQAPYLTEYYCKENTIKNQTYNCQTYCMEKQGGTTGTCKVNETGEGYCKCTVLPATENKKNMEKYTGKEAFLISDRDWQAVLTLVPVATWTKKNGTIKKYPLLIFHDETHLNSKGVYISDNTSDIRVDLRDKKGKEVSALVPSTKFRPNTLHNVGDVTKMDLSIRASSQNKTADNITSVKITSYPSYLTPNQTEIQSNITLKPGEKSTIKNFSFTLTSPPLPGFDADSIAYFFQQYQPSRVTIAGQTPSELDSLLVADNGNMVPGESLGAGLGSDQIQRINTSEYLQYWKTYKDAVYVENNYELALLASAYASLINAPLIIKGYNDNLSLKGKNVICIGNPTTKCNEQYTLEELQKKYLKKTNTNKIILVNPNDLKIAVKETFTPEKSSKSINELYSKTSLAAPILASAKHELIISTTTTDYKQVDEFIENKINALGLNASYLTIVASPPAIPMSRKANSYDDCLAAKRIEVDNRYYGSVGHSDECVDLSVGRVMGYTVSDVSSYIARDLLFDELKKNRDALLFINEKLKHSGYTSYKDFYSDKVKDQFNSTTLSDNAPCKSYNKEEYGEKDFILFYDHGTPHMFWKLMSTKQMRENQAYLDSPTIVDVACATCAYQYAKNGLFCVENIRRGAMAFQGAVDISYWHNQFDEILNEAFLNGKTIGDAIRIAKNSDYENLESLHVTNYCIGLKGDPYYILVGDPTFKPRWW